MRSGRHGQAGDDQVQSSGFQGREQLEKIHQLEFDFDPHGLRYSPRQVGFETDELALLVFGIERRLLAGHPHDQLVFLQDLLKF